MLHGRRRCCFPGAADFIRAAAAGCRSRSHRARCATRSTRSSRPPGLTISSRRSSRPATRRESKPSPAPYLLAFEQLQQTVGRDLDPRRCVAIEDSVWGLESARRAGLRCVGVTNKLYGGRASRRRAGRRGSSRADDCPCCIRFGSDADRVDSVPPEHAQRSRRRADGRFQRPGNRRSRTRRW